MANCGRPGPPLKWAAPVLLTLLGAWLRFYHLADAYANVDHAYPIAQAIRWLQLGQWPLLGQGTSELFANPPGMSYLMALPWALFGSEWGATFFSAAVNLLAVPLAYRAGKLAGGRRAGLAAAALIALNPWTIFFSRGTWVQGLLPFWTTLTCALLLAALFGRGARENGARRAGLLFAALLALAGLTQMYLLALLSFAPVTLILLLNWRRVPLRGLLAGTAVLALTTGFFGLQLARDWPNQAPKLAKFMQRDMPARLDRTALNHAVRFVTGADFAAVYGATSPARRTLGQGVTLILGVVLALGVLRAIWRVAARRPDAGLWLAVLIWWAVPIAALSYPNHPVNVAYLLLSLPAGYLLAAPILAALARARLGLPLLAALSLYSFVLVSAGTAQVAANPVDQSLDGLSVGAALKLRPVAQTVAGQYHVDELYTELDAASLTAKVGEPLQAVSWAPLPNSVLFQVDHPAVYMRLGQGDRRHLLRLASPVAEVDFPDDEVVAFDVIRAFTRAELSTLPRHPVDWPSAQGLTLVGYDLRPGSRNLWVYWTVDELAPGRDQWIYAPYAHVADAQGRLVANIGAPGLPGYYYRQGDVFLSHLRLPPLPAGPYQLDLGMYDGVHGLSLSLAPPGGGATDHYGAEYEVR